MLGVALLCILTMLLLSLAVKQDLGRLETATSDNVQWTLSQAEVEFMDFHYLLENYSRTEDDGARLRRAFDVFYSRINTLESGGLYAGPRDTAVFSRNLKLIRAYLDRNVGIIDNLQSATEEDLEQFEKETDELRSSLRRVSNSGLYYFAEQSDKQREAVALSLKRLALVTASLIAALALLAFYSHRVSQQIMRSRTELHSAHTRLNSIVTASLDAVLVSDVRGHILEFNAAAEKVFGYKEEDVLGCELRDVIIPPHFLEAHDAGMARMLRTGEKRVVGHGRVVLEGKRKSGECFPMELAIEAAGEGEQTIFIGFMRDITEQVKAETELREARDKALAGEKAKSDFLAVMTHEIRTPLNGVLGNLSLLEDTTLTEKQKRYTRNMSISAGVLMSHVDTVLDISRFESGVTQPRKEPTHLGHLLRDIVDAQRGNAKANGNVLESMWVGQPVDWVLTDAPRLHQVILNLVGNAIKFTDDGRISIEAERLYRNTNTKTVEIEFRIIDTGIGINKEDMARIFEDFHTVDSSFKRNTSGTGLGLGIVRRLVEAMGGSAGVDSELGEGSVFWIRMPFEETHEPKPVTEIEQGTDNQTPLEILVVEDNEINLQIVREMLLRKGHNVSTATDGLAGVNTALAQQFDLILMDISMPVLDGLEASERIRKESGPSQTAPIFALSANVLPEIQARIEAAGMDGFLGKPFHKDELTTVLNKAFDRKTKADAAAVDEMMTKSEPSPLELLHVRFVTETQELMDWLGTMPDDFEALAKRSHKVAGSAGAFDEVELRDALIAIETAAATPENRNQLHERINAALSLWNARDDLHSCKSHD